MSGTFSSFSTSLSAMNHNRVLMDVAASNIANATTAGYTRRRVEAETVGAPAQPAMWSRYEGHGEGVRIADVARMSDEFLTARSRHEHGQQSYLTTRFEVLSRYEAGIGEPGENGVAAALDSFRGAWHDLALTPDGSAARSQVLDRAATLAESLGIQARNLDLEDSGLRSQLADLTTEVNTLAADLASTNDAVRIAGFTGADANLLLDQRDALALRLAQLTGGVATQNADGGLDVHINGTALVQGDRAGELVLTAGSAGGPVSLGITTDGVTVDVPAGTRGEVGAVADLLTTTLPTYRANLDAVVRELAGTVNAQHRLGFDQDGAPGGDVFTFDDADPSGTLAVALTDLRQVAASQIPGGGRDGSNADLLATGPLAGGAGVQDSYQKLVNGFGSEVASTQRLALNQAALTSQVDGARDQLAGVNYDEELVTLVSSQRAYEAASRVMTTLDQMLDTLINRTGLVGR